jgi:outer membrane receptor protein involved in Fe transport
MYKKILGCVVVVGCTIGVAAGEKVDLSWRWMLGRLIFCSTSQYVTNYYAEDGRKKAIPAYLVMDAKLTYQILPGLGVFLAVNNLFNEEYVTYVNLPEMLSGCMPCRGGVGPPV